MHVSSVSDGSCSSIDLVTYITTSNTSRAPLNEKSQLLGNSGCGALRLAGAEPLNIQHVCDFRTRIVLIWKEYHSSSVVMLRATCAFLCEDLYLSRLINTVVMVYFRQIHAKMLQITDVLAQQEFTYCCRVPGSSSAMFLSNILYVWKEFSYFSEDLLGREPKFLI